MRAEPQNVPAPDESEPIIDTEHLLVLIEVAAAGSFSEAARRLRCSQSTISNSIAALERQLGLLLFDRSARPPVLTPEGRSLISDARGVANRLNMMKARARNLAQGIEGEIGIAIDQIFPSVFIVDAVSAFHSSFPTVNLRIFTDSLGGVSQLVIDKVCDIGIAYAAPSKQDKLHYRNMGEVELAPVASADHPLSKMEGPIPKDTLREFTLITSADRSHLMDEVMPVIQPNWQVSGIEVMYSLIRLGLGWGYLPLYKVESDLSARRLVRLPLENWPTLGAALVGIHRTDTLPGPGARWLLTRLNRLISLRAHD